MQHQNERGLALVELLATIAISSLIIILITSLLLFIQKQYTNQSSHAKEFTDINIALKTITKDICSNDIDFSESNSAKLQFTNGTFYLFDEKKEVLIKGGAEYIHEIKHFHVTFDELEKVVSLDIESTSGKKAKTTLAVRTIRGGISHE